MRDDDGGVVYPHLTGSDEDIKEAWKYFVWGEAFEWKHLPCAGGLEDQDEMLMNNIFEIRRYIYGFKKNG